jgi:signal peptidase I
MKKKIKVLGLIVLGIVIIYNFLLRPLGWFVIYNNPTTSNVPNIELNSKALGTNLIESDNGDFVCYKFNDEILGDHIRVHRQVAKEKDTVKIVNGNLIVNGENVDATLNLNHAYKIDKTSLDSIKKIVALKNADGYFNGAEYIIYLSDEYINKNNFKLTRLRDSINHSDEEIYGVYNMKWNKDHFGPLIIPKNKIFVLGDNRDFTIDSRTIGLIDVEDIVGVFFKVF